MSQVSGSPLRWLLPASIAALVVWGVAQRVMTREALAREAQDAALPRVAVVQVQRASEAEQLTLPAELRARQEAPIYARTSGYLKAWYTDIGTPVKRGQLLAEVDTPEVDQQLAQARADLARAQADAALAQSTHERWQALRAADSVSQQEADQKAGAAATAQAALLSAKANLARLQQLSDFKRVLAPFDGVVVARNTDVGALISAGESSGGELFRVADLRSLRVYARVPQLYADDMQPGLAAQISLSERPGAQYPAKLLRTAGALDAQTRSLQVELALDNTQAQLLPGAYAEVSFALAPHSDSLRVPANTVLFRAEGLQLATVDAQQRVHLKGIRLGRDFGTSLEVLEGLGVDDQVVLNPSDSLSEGMQVRVMKPAAESKKAS